MYCCTTRSSYREPYRLSIDGIRPLYLAYSGHFLVLRARTPLERFAYVWWSLHTFIPPLLSGLFILPQLNTIAVTCTCIIYFVSIWQAMDRGKTKGVFSSLGKQRSFFTVWSLRWYTELLRTVVAQGEKGWLLYYVHNPYLLSSSWSLARAKKVDCAEGSLKY